MRNFILLIFCIVIAGSLSAQSKDEWFPSNLNIQPFTANFIEPRAGFSYILGEKELRLDIGTSSDIYHYIRDNAVLSFGADLFTYTRLRGEKEFHFPVDAVDYLFGFNSGYKILCLNREYGFRFRLSHISAHFADGHFDTGSNEWRNGRKPTVYSREFIELFPYYKVHCFRTYLGLTYLFHVTPKNIGKGIYQAGFDYFASNLLTEKLTPFIAYDFKLNNIDNIYMGNNILSAGIKFGRYNSKGISISFNYFSGRSIHGEYYNVIENYSTLGINVDL